VRGDEQRAAIRTVLGAFGHDSRPFVFIGGCVLGLYARPDGAPLRATNDVDCISTLSPHGLNVGGVNPWFERAARHAREYDVGEGRTVNAVTPPYFLATKLVAFENRGPDASSSKDAEDIVTLIVETADIVEQVELAQIRVEIAELLGRALAKYALAPDDVPDLVDWHLDPRDAARREDVVNKLTALAHG